MCRPFGACSELLTDYVYDNYIVPVVVSWRTCVQVDRQKWRERERERERG